MNKRARSSNFTPECTFNLVDIIDKYRNIIENKRTDAVMWQEKKNAWHQIADEFNFTATERRTPEQLKQKYETLKKEARKDAAAKLQNPQQTGVPLIKEKSLPLYAKLRRMMDLSAEEFPHIHILESMDDLETQIQQAENISQAEEEEDDDVIEVIGPTVVMNDGCEVVIPSGSSAPEEVRSDSNPDNIRKGKDMMPESSSTPGEHENHIGVSHSKKRRQPEHIKSSHKHLFTGRRLRSWVIAREELVSLQKDLLLKEFKEKERREGELHQINMSIKQVQLRNEELENRIKVEKLRKLMQENQDFEEETQWK